MVLTTMPSPVDMAEHFPGTVPFARETIRLHPRRGIPGIGDSSLGGPLLWPSDELWPMCSEKHFAGEAEFLPPCNRVAVAQLYARDVPALPFPDDTDLMQVLWCPLEHLEYSCPEPIVVWRASADVADVLTDVPDPLPEAEERHLPKACHVSPEPVLEYPSVELPHSVERLAWAEAKRVQAETGWDFFSDLTVAPGIKVGGFPGWTQNPDWPNCSCGVLMDHLMTIASWEFSGTGPSRWLPLEERHLAAGLANMGWREAYEVLKPIREAAGIMLGDAGGIYLFVCPSCPQRPTDYRFDCS